MNFARQIGAFTGEDLSIINANFALLNGLTQGQGTVYFLDPANGNDAYNGLSPTAQSDGVTGPKRSLLGAYNVCGGSSTSGQNDTVALLANGATSGTARVDSAFTWAKNETHLIGLCSPVLLSQRARLAPSSTTTAFANFFTLSASGCAFQNIGIFDGFTTGTTSQICMTITGSRNYFRKCQIAGMGDTTSATSAGSRSLKIGLSGSGENVFEDCTIGLDTVSRTGANASVEFTNGGSGSGTVRNVFRGCLFPFYSGDGNSLGILGTGANCVDRWQEFDRCTFMNAIKSGATAMTVNASFTSASAGGLVIFKDCASVGITKFGDTTALALSYIDMAAVSASAGGLMVNPS